MFGGSSRQPYWPGVQNHTGAKAKPDNSSVSGKTAFCTESVSEFLLKEQESLGVSTGQAATGQKRAEGEATGIGKVAPAASTGKDDRERDKDKTKPGNGNLAIVAAVAVLGIGGFVTGQIFVKALQKLAPASNVIVVKKKRLEPSEYAKTIRRYQAAGLVEGIDEEDAPGESPDEAVGAVDE